MIYIIIFYYTVLHFADDTNLMLTSNSLKMINKHINHDLKLLTRWLRANRISLNASKTEIIIFRPRSKINMTKHLNFRISGQHIKRTSEVKYLGILFDETLSWNTHLLQLTKKLNRAIGLLSKIRHYSSPDLLKTIYFSLFHSHLIYGCQIWGQGKRNDINKIVQLQHKAIRIINFLPRNHPILAKYSELKILNLNEQIILQNILFVKKYLNKTSSNSFSKFLKPVNEIHNHVTRSTDTYQLSKHTFKTEKYGRNSILQNSINDWNKYQILLKTDFNKCSFKEIKKQITNYFFEKYKNN